MEKSINKFIQANSPDGGFLQSEEWRKFQESYGRKTFQISSEFFHANVIEHELRIVGKYFYIPRGPLGEEKIEDIIELAKKNKANWVRIDPVDSEILQKIRQSIKHKIMKAPHDMQSKEILVIDIAKSEEQLMTEMKSKTRYNIRLAEKKGLRIRSVNSKMDARKYFNEFLRLIKATSKRQGISSHPENYYRQMWESLPEEMRRLYLAEHKGKIISANLVLFYGKFATYLHGASDDQFRDLMAPYALQWQTIQDAKKRGCERYDFGGVSSGDSANQKWAGITKFKIGFSPETKPIEFSGSYDIIINNRRYYLYKTLQVIKKFLK